MKHPTQNRFWAAIVWDEIFAREMDIEQLTGLPSITYR